MGEGAKACRLLLQHVGSVQLLGGRTAGSIVSITSSVQEASVAHEVSPGLCMSALAHYKRMLAHLRAPGASLSIQS